MKKYINIFILLLFVSSFSFSQSESELYSKLKTIKEISSIEVIKADTTFKEAYEIMFEQPFDHQNLGGPKFKQRIFLSHLDFTKPVVFINEGYAANRNYKSELSRIIESNQIIVEHRYFGKSTLGVDDWQYLTTKQSSDDHYAIINALKKIYNGKWISTGISKGGQTSIFLKYYHPDAVDVSVPYVAPLNLSQEDPRIYEFFYNVGDEECRSKVTQFQRTALQRRDEILPMIKEYSSEKKYTYSIGLDFAYEYAVLEYAFSFWQWYNDGCNKIPAPDAPAKEYYENMKSLMDYVSDQSQNYFAPFMYQAYTEVGYYGYEIGQFSDVLKFLKGDIVSSCIFFPNGCELKFNNELMPKVNQFIQEKGNNMLYIYGELDAWSSTAVEIGSKTNAVKMVKKGGSHRTRINSFSDEEKENIFNTLENWLDIKINRN